MSDRVTLERAARMASMSLSRGTPRGFEDNHLMQEITEVDVFHSETHSNRGAPLERWQMVGITAHPLKQEEDKQQKKSSGEDDGFNHDQPKGKSSEALMLYLNGSRSHPVALVDDRRVRPYGMKEGEGAVYAADGSEQMLFFKEDGTHLVSLDGKSVKDKANSKTRSLVTGHVTKKMQSHDGEKVKDEKDYKHEGETINTGIRYSKDKIEFVADDAVVGYYDKSSQTWFFKGKIAQMEFTEKIERTAPTISETVSTRFETIGKTVLGIDTKSEETVISETGDIPAKQTFIKLVT